MELRHLRYFVAVAEELHFRRAAERLYVAQPAVSEQVRKLEQELGVRLFDRTQRRVSLTTAGGAMLEEARRVLLAADVAMQAARSAGDSATMPLRIGYVPDALPSVVPRALRRLVASAPRVQVELETGAALRLIEDLRSRRLDAVVVSLPAPANGLRVMRLADEHAVAVLPVVHPLAVEPAVALDQLAPERLVMLPAATNPAFRNAVIGMCRDAGLAPTLVELAEPRVEHVLLAVAAGAGLALLPESVAERYASPGVRLVAVRDAQPAVHTALLTHHDAEDLATVAFQRAISHALRDGADDARRAVTAVA
jgi:DNA-binding transcriptional LysR family regulator